MKARDEMIRTLRESVRGRPWIDRDDLIDDAMYTVYAKFLVPVMRKFANLGAYDTEPREVAQDDLVSYARDSFRILRYAGEKQALYDAARNAREGREDFEAALRLLRSAHAFWTERGTPPPGIGAEGFESTRDANSTVARLCNAIEDSLKLLSGPYKGLRLAFQEVRLDPRIKRQVAVAFKRAGLDGNGRFEKPGQGYSKAFEILGDFGMSLEDLADSHIFSMDQGSQRLRMVFTNPGDPFSPTPIKNSVLVISHHKMETDKYEVLAYLS